MHLGDYSGKTTMATKQSPEDPRETEALEQEKIRQEQREAAVREEERRRQEEERRRQGG